MQRLLGIAGEYGIEVVRAALPGDTTGWFVPDENRIYLDLRLTPCELRTTLAHEIGHAFYGHNCSTPAAERQADRYAAELLIDPRRFAQLERVNPDEHFLADELGVTVDLVFFFETHCLARVQGFTYAFPRMGAGQSAYAEAYA